MQIKGEAFGECIAKIAARGSMGKQEALAVIQEVAARGDKMRQTGQADPFVYAAAELADQLKTSARLDRLDALRNAAIRNGVMSNIAKAGGLKRAALTVQSLLYGTSKAGRDSIQAMARGLTANWQAVLANKLRQAGMEKVAISGSLDAEVAEGLWRGHGAPPNTQIKVSKGAQAIADAIRPLQDLVRARLNAVGARIGDALDYVAHQEHDPRKMRLAAGPRQSVDAAFASWWTNEQPRWAESTFDNLVPNDGETTQQARTRFARSIYDALLTGVHMTAKGATGLETDDKGFPTFEGGRNIARKISQPRVIHYKDSTAWIDHARQYGASPTLTAGIMKTLDQSGRQAALLSKLGTNPAANLDQIIRKVEETYRSDPDGLKKFQAKQAGIRNVMGRLDGSLNIPTNEMAAKLGASVRTFESMSSLGGVGVTHFASIWPTVTSELRHHGVSRLQALGNMVSALVKGKGSAERQEILADLGAFGAGLSRDALSTWQPEDSLPGKVSAVANTFMKWTGIQYVFDNTQAGVREMLAHQLGRSTGKGFDELDPHLSQMLGKYGIAQPEWDMLRAVGNATPSPAAGMLRIFRGEGGTTGGMGGLGGSVVGGQWFTSDLARAKRYAGQDGHVVYLDVDPNSKADMIHFSYADGQPDEYKASPEILSRVRRTGGDLPTDEGRAYMTPDTAMKIDPAEAEAELRARGQIGAKAKPDVVAEKVDAYRRDIADKLLSYYGDAADHAVVTPGVRERAILLGSTRPGSAAGELLRFVTQFKIWPVAAMTQMIGREVYMGLSKTETAVSLFTMAALSSVAGYLRMSVSDTATGRPLRNPLDPATMLAGLAQGGGMGILGDFLFGQTSRSGGGLVTTLAGPTIGDLDAIDQLFNRWKSDPAKTNLWPELARLASQHVPFANLVYLKGAFDYLLWYHLFAAASPTWWENTNRQLERDQGRGMVGYTPGGGVPYGVPGVYLKNNAGQTFGLFGQNK